MRALLLWVGRLSGAAGVVLCAVAIAARLSGLYHLGGFQVVTLLQAGTTAMVAAALAYVAAIADTGR